VVVNRHLEVDDTTGMPNCGSGGYDPAKPMVTISRRTRRTTSSSSRRRGSQRRIRPATRRRSVRQPEARAGHVGLRRLGLSQPLRRQAGKVERIDSYAIPEALDPAFERGISTVLVWLRRLSDGCGA
jgi:hypothetical protein